MIFKLPITQYLLEALKKVPELFRVLEEMPEYDAPGELPLIFEPYSREQMVKEQSRFRPINIIDLETTGFDREKDEVIELAIVRCFYDAKELKLASIEGFERHLNEPKHATISAEITDLTGICLEDVVGKSIDWKKFISYWFHPEVLNVAHNAEFDFQMLWEAILKAGVPNPHLRIGRFACSHKEIGWKGQGAECQKLGCLARQHSFFFDAHRAVNDCFALAEIFKRNDQALAALLGSSRKETWMCMAHNFPRYENEVLKERGFRAHYVGKTFQYWYRTQMDVDEARDLKKFLKEYDGYDASQCAWRRQDAFNRYMRLERM